MSFQLLAKAGSGTDQVYNFVKKLKELLEDDDGTIEVLSDVFS